MDWMSVGASHKGRVFYSYLLSFVLILFIPVLMSFFVFRKANEIVFEETNRANDVLLQQTKTYIDMIMDDVLQLNFLISYNGELEALLYERFPVTGDDYYRAYRLVEEFVDYRVSSTGAVDFYVYLPNLDMVVAPDGYFTTHSYDLARRSARMEDYANWITGVEGVQRQQFRSNRSAMAPFSNAKVPTIELVSPLPVSAPTTTPRGWAVIHIDERLFTQLFEGTVWSEHSTFLIYHNEHGLVSSSDELVTPAVLGESGVQPAVLPNVSDVELFGTPYVAFALDSDVVNWRYVSLIPRDLYTNRFTALRRFTLAAFALCTLVGGLMIYWLAAVRYRPIHNLLAMLEPGADGVVTLRSDEFDMIKSSLRSTLAEERLLRQQVVESRPVLLQRYIRQLLQGSEEATPLFRRRLEELGVTFAHDWFVLILVETDPDSRPMYPKIATFLEDAWPGQLNVDYVVVRELNGTIAVLATQPSGEIFAFSNEVVQAKNTIEQRFSLSCAFGVSGIHPEGRFPNLLHEAQTALSYRLVQGGRDPIFFSQVVTTGRTYYYPIEEETKLINSIVSGSHPAASAILQSVFAANFDKAQLTVEMARCLMFDLISTMIKALNSISSVEQDGRFWSEVKPILRLTACRSLERLRFEMNDILRDVCTHVRSGRSSHAEHLREEILAYIDAHFRDRNLGPGMVADHFNKNSAYLSRFFREEIGVGMSIYIKKQRITAAKELLSHAAFTIREIADRVGFVDSNALIRAFKHHEGVTPGEFRESVGK